MLLAAAAAVAQPNDDASVRIKNILSRVGTGAADSPVDMETIKLKGYDTAAGSLFVGGQVTHPVTPTTGMYSGDTDWKSFTSTVYGTGKDNPIEPTGLLDALCANRDPPLAGGATGCDCYNNGQPLFAERTCADGNCVQELRRHLGRPGLRP